MKEVEGAQIQVRELKTVDRSTLTLFKSPLFQCHEVSHVKIFCVLYNLIYSFMKTKVVKHTSWTLIHTVLFFVRTCTFDSNCLSRFTVLPSRSDKSEKSQSNTYFY